MTNKGFLEYLARKDVTYQAQLLATKIEEMKNPPETTFLEDLINFYKKCIFDGGYKIIT